MLNLKNNVFLVLLLMTSLNVKSSNSYAEYYKYMIEAMTFEANENYNNAYESYKKAFDTAYPYVDDIITAIKCCQKSDFSSETPLLIQKLIMCGYKRESENIPVIVREQEQYFKWIKEREFEFSEYEFYFDSIYDNCRKKYLANIDKESDRYLSVFNQFELFTIFMRSSCPDDKEQQFIQKVAWGISCQSLLNLYYSGIDICRQNTDTWNDDRFIACLIHVGQESPYLNREKEYFSFLQQMVLVGNLHPRQYAQIKDAVMVLQKSGKSHYGESISFDSERMRVKINELDNPSEIDKNRAEIFLPPLWVIAKLNNYILPSNYKY